MELEKLDRCRKKTQMNSRCIEGMDARPKL